MPRILSSLLLALALHLLSGSAAAQELAVAELRGRVLLAETPLPGARVVLHHVDAFESGPVDSLLSARDGGFRFRLPNVPDPETDPAIWFASVLHQGVTYFSEPIQLAIQLDSVQTIRVFDSETAPPGGAALPVTARYTLMEQEAEQWFLTDLLHPRNETGRTLIAGAGGATWVYPLPEGASDLQLGGEQMAPSTAEIVDGNLRVSSPIQPGIQEVIVRYRIPEPYITLRYPGATDSVELMIREPAPVAVAGLANGQPVEMEPGVRYRRFAGTGLVDAVVSLTESKEPPTLPMRWVTVGIALLLTVAGVVAVLRPHPSVVLPGQRVASTIFDARMSPFERRQLLLLEVARLDEARARGEAPDDEWSNRRRTLLDRARELGR